jgi:hypothetical protein
MQLAVGFGELTRESVADRKLELAAVVSIHGPLGARDSTPAGAIRRHEFCKQIEPASLATSGGGTGAIHKPATNGC